MNKPQQILELEKYLGFKIKAINKEPESSWITSDDIIENFFSKEYSKSCLYYSYEIDRNKYDYVVWALNLSNCDLTDISFLHGLEQKGNLINIFREKKYYEFSVIRYLDLSYNRISDFSPLKNLPLERLEIFSNPIDFLTLQSLSIAKPQIIYNLESELGFSLKRTSIGGIDKDKISYSKSYCIHQNKIIGLNLRMCQIKDISFLNAFKDLKSLNLSNNFIYNIDSITHLKSLTSLQIHGNPIKSFASLKYLKLSKPLEIFKLESFLYFELSKYVESNSIYVRMQEVRTLPELSIDKIENHNSYMLSVGKIIGLSIRLHTLKNIDFLETFTDIMFLNLQFNKIKDITVLGKLQKLVILNLFSNQINDISPLNDLPSLQELYLNNNPFMQEILQEIQEKPDLEILQYWKNTYSKKDIKTDEIITHVPNNVIVEKRNDTDRDASIQVLIDKILNLEQKLHKPTEEAKIKDLEKEIAILREKLAELPRTVISELGTQPIFEIQNNPKNMYGQNSETQGIKEVIEILIERKNFFLKEKAIASDAAIKFSLQKQIEQIEQEIKDLRNEN